MNTFGRAIREYRIKSDKTLAEVAEILNVRVSFLCDIEQGRRSPLSPMLLKRFCDALCADEKKLLQLASKEKSCVEIPLGPKGIINEMAFALARHVHSNTIDDGTAEKILNILKGPQSNGESMVTIP